MATTPSGVHASTSSSMARASGEGTWAGGTAGAEGPVVLPSADARRACGMRKRHATQTLSRGCPSGFVPDPPAPDSVHYGEESCE